MCALPEPCRGGAHQDDGTDLEGAHHGCTDPQCDAGIIPNPYSDDPEDLTLCPACNHGYDPRDHHDYAG
ncbi:hypothetical protein [Streptomyces sp. NPDC090036]|uniref:hypothetical protein n=1 Tax=Streptomyces sp. NPDC090036 TaxID=3365926 RepID=UPI003803C483